MRRTSALFLLVLVAACANQSQVDGEPPADAGVSADAGAPPTAAAGADQTVVIGERAVLNGSASTDPEGAVLSFQWHFVSVPDGSTATLTDPAVVNPSFVPDELGEYRVALTVEADGQESEPDLVVVTAVPVPNGAPVASAGPDRTVVIGNVAYLSGSGSYDPEGDALTYEWAFESRPAGSEAVLTGSTSRAPAFTPDRIGPYVVRLVVSDGTSTSEPDEVVVNVVEPPNRAPKADAGPDQETMVGVTVSLDGSASSDPDGDPLSWLWQIQSAPDGSTATLSDPGVADPTFVPDLGGTYTLSLVVSDGTAQSAPSSMSVVVYAPSPGTGPLVGLSFRVVDAEYSRTLDRIVAVGTSPNALHIYDPANDTDVSVPLSLAPTSVSVGPDGHQAVVGHNGWITRVDLQTGTVLGVLPVTTDAVDVVLAGNGFAYVFPRRDQWESIRCIELATGTETNSGGWSIYAGTVAKLHPDGDRMYGADNGVSPSDIERYDITDGTARVAYDSPYHGDYPMCGNLWISEDGIRIFTACGNVFRATESQTDDMTYAGALGSDHLAYVDHSLAAGKVVSVPLANSWLHTSDNSVSLYDYEYLALDRTVILPWFVLGGSAYEAHARFAFFDAAGTHVYVIVQADPEAGMLDDYAVVAVTP